MKKIILILLLMLIGFVLVGKTVTLTVPLPELMKPHALAVDESQIYIAEEATVFVYSAKDFKFIKKFGKQGEGPQEFKGRAARVIIQPDHLFISSAGKVSYFTKEGKFIKELRTMAPDMRVKPFGDLFVAARTLIENGIFYVPVNIYDSNLKMIKEIYRVRRGVQVGGKGTIIFSHPLPFYPVEDKLFIAKEKELVIEALDKKGNKLYAVTYNYEK